MPSTRVLRLPRAAAASLRTLFTLPRTSARLRGPCSGSKMNAPVAPSAAPSSNGDMVFLRGYPLSAARNVRSSKQTPNVYCCVWVMHAQAVRIPSAGDVALEAQFHLPAHPSGVVVLAGGSGAIAAALAGFDFATLLFD